jgi:hypothetical protein
MVKRNTVMLPAERDLAEALRAGAIANAKRDLNIAEEWFPVDEETRRASLASRKAAQGAGQ